MKIETQPGRDLNPPNLAVPGIVGSGLSPCNPKRSIAELFAMAIRTADIECQPPSMSDGDSERQAEPTGEVCRRILEDVPGLPTVGRKKLKCQSRTTADGFLLPDVRLDWSFLNLSEFAIIFDKMKKYLRRSWGWAGRPHSCYSGKWNTGSASALKTIHFNKFSGADSNVPS